MAKKDDAKFSVKPLDDRIVVEPLDAEESTTGGILLPDTAKQKPQRGKVLAIGYMKGIIDGMKIPYE